MKIEFDYWDKECDEESKIFITMDCIPNVGEIILVPKKFFPAYYFSWWFSDSPIVVEYDEKIRIEVKIIQHNISKSGAHQVQICFDFEMS